VQQQIAIIGAGRVGTAIAFLAIQKGYEVVGLCCRTIENARRAAAFLDLNRAVRDMPGPWIRDAGMVLITTPDDVIRDVCERMISAGFVRAGAIVAHCSGAHPSSILQSAADAGCPVGSVHPLQSCATRELAVTVLPGSYFCIEGSDAAKVALRRLARALGGEILEIRTADKPLYHAGAAVASNFLVGLINFALTLYERIGIDRRSGIQALAPLFEGTIRNIKAVGIPEALTGPIMRGDLGTVQTHLEAIARATPSYISLYCALGRETVTVAKNKGTIDGATGNAFRELFERFEGR